MHVTIVVPCFNELATLGRLHSAVEQALDDIAESWDLLFIDDGSTDGSARLLPALAQADPRVGYVSFSRNFGKESALLAGLSRARGDVVVMMDGDLQHPPDLLPAMVAQHLQGYDQVIARRTRSHDGRLRSALTRMYYAGMKRMVDVPLIDGAGDFRLLSRRAVDALLALPEYNRFSKGLFSWIGFETAVIDYADVARDSGSSKWSLRALLNYGIDGLLSFNDRPIRLCIYAGLVTTSLSFMYVLWLLFRYLAQGVETPGYITLVTAVIGFGGIQLIVLGLLGEYVGRIYYEVKRRPHYVVRDGSAARDATRPTSSAEARETMVARW